MHLSDAFLSPPVAIGADLLSVGLIALSAKKLKREERSDLIPLMGVMGAFVFVAQMINFTIPGTGSSGHLIGGILLSAILGPWAAFIALCSILIVQCLIFADGGILALGCNIINMAATTCLIAYPLIFRPIVTKNISSVRLSIAAVASSVFALELGAFAVTLETEFSGITALPFSSFMAFMLPIHLVIGLIEGIVTALLLIFILKSNPSVLAFSKKNSIIPDKKKGRLFYGACIALTLVLGVSFSVLASQNPDGLEWSIEKVAGPLETDSYTLPTAIIPDYDSSFAGIIGAIIVILLVWAISSLIFAKLKKRSSYKS